MKIFVNENTDSLIKDIRKYVKNTKNSQTTIDTLDLCHMLGKIEYLEEKKRRLEINVLVNDKELERLNKDFIILKELQMKTNEENNRLNNIINELYELLEQLYYLARSNETRSLIANKRNELKELKENK